jgi:hypothetical protein
MTETQLQNLNFNKVEQPPYLDDPGFYYYEYDIGEMYLLSNTNDEAVDLGWQVSIFEYDDIVFTDADDLNHLMTLIKANLVR